MRCLTLRISARREDPVRLRPAAAMREDTEVTRLNMTPMIDVVFQLLVFFLCSMKFRTLDMKIEAQLPNVGSIPIVCPPPPPAAEVRLRRAGAGPAEVRVGAATIGDVALGSTWDRLHDHLVAVHRRASDAGIGDRLIGEVDAAPGVATGHVVRALDVLRGAGIDDVRFRGTPPVR